LSAKPARSATPEGGGAGRAATWKACTRCPSLVSLSLCDLRDGPWPWQWE
jgi:hypothetical protein